MRRLARATLLCCAPIGAMGILAAGLLVGGTVAAAAVPAKDPLAVDVVRLDVDQAKQVEVVSQRKSADDRELAIVLRPIAGQFTIDLDLVGRDFQRVRITIRGTKRHDIVRYFTDLKRRPVYIDLGKIPGVDIFRSGDDLMIDFTTPKAALVLPPEGRLLFREVFAEGDKTAKP